MLIRIVLLFFVSVVFLCFKYGSKDEIIIQSIPDNWPIPVYDFNKNPVTKEGFELGRMLFHDPGLSRDSTISCASCHSQFNAFTHVDHALSHGIEDRIGRRNSPVLINLAWVGKFHWDGGVVNLQMQPLNPITNKDEMDNSLENVLLYLNDHPQYPSLFFKAFGDSAIRSADLLKALEQYTVSLISANSKYDQYIRGEVLFTDQELKGLKLFRKHCSTCHPEPLFTTNGFENNGMALTEDLGRYEITGVESDKYKFKVPTLRNIAYSFPYMHNGSIIRLQDVVEHYADQIDHSSPYLSADLKEKLKLSSKDRKDLLAFLNTLTDKTFLFNKNFMP